MEVASDVLGDADDGSRRQCVADIVADKARNASVVCPFFLFIFARASFHTLFLYASLPLSFLISFSISFSSNLVFLK